ncbi:MAG: aminomethyl-transferring glycine dehydrogenase subunit GcvPB [Bacteroidaceae bacterium]|nr:aminomethyl-transferring glycine dehydrogenase subunit GcvPB [Bacteroidaceae bacterium]MBR1790893.1 aminomethyl-transferring glycine dehydrogenase subunit GcvPB [Bacteroidaceae bacterium]
MNRTLYGNLIFELSKKGRKGYSLPQDYDRTHTTAELPEALRRSEAARLPECDELTVVRHYTNLSHNNFGVNDGFYPLGSCTMKYNPVINEEIAAMKAFAGLHPLQPAETCQGALEVYYNLQQSLAELAGLSEFTLNPCAGAHGELTGLMVIRAYHEAKAHPSRTKVLIPDSAHGTNPASAAVCGLEVVEVKSLPDGTVDVAHLRQLLDEIGDQVAAMMMTNPNTLGIFEPRVLEITKMVHEAGGLMYYDGANLNALLGECRPGDMGFDVMHINLHKTFSTPHGGGGPGSGPVGVRKGLEQFLPYPRVKMEAPPTATEGGTAPLFTVDFGKVSSSGDDGRAGTSLGSVGSFFGNYGVMLKAYAYILSLGREHVKQVGPLATLNANYIKERLRDDYLLPIQGLCKHEVVFDGLVDKSTGVTTMDVAKRLLDYGYHAPTIYFPLLFHESLMIEPTENESKETIDAFINVMHTIAAEAKSDPELVKTAPHNTPIGRVDDVLAAKHPITTYWKSLEN